MAGRAPVRFSFSARSARPRFHPVGHGSILWAGRPRASLSTSKPVTAKAAELSLSLLHRREHRISVLRHRPNKKVVGNMLASGRRICIDIRHALPEIIAKYGMKFIESIDSMRCRNYLKFSEICGRR